MSPKTTRCHMHKIAQRVERYTAYDPTAAEENYRAFAHELSQVAPRLLEEYGDE